MTPDTESHCDQKHMTKNVQEARSLSIKKRHPKRCQPGGEKTS